MTNTDERVDAYIQKSAEFARPILEHLRALVHRTQPDVVETIKWGSPYFTRNGRILCMMAAFKQHAVFGFWDAPHMKDAKKFLAAFQNTSMGHFGRLTSVEDLPSDKQLVAYIREAVAIGEKGVKSMPNKSGTAKKPLPTPKFFAAALAKNKLAKEAFAKMPPSHRREYLLWFAEAKRQETRDRRVAQALEWIADGKSRSWKYERK